LRWRLIVDGPLPGAFNMALDEELAITAARAEVATLRLYQWQRPTLSLGRHEPADELPLARCEAAGIALVRRPTGGRAVLHHLELTYSFTAPASVVGGPKRVREAYSLITKALARGLGLLGIKALAGSESPRLAGHMCFALKTGCDLEVKGRKLVGSALRRYEGAVLQHGAIPLALDPALPYVAFGEEGEDFEAFASRLRAAVVPLRELLGRVITPEELVAPLARGFEESFGITLQTLLASKAELTRAKERAKLFALSGRNQTYKVELPL
jgi:lipoate-protein ligase A